jgi:hypothetical protein
MARLNTIEIDEKTGRARVVSPESPHKPFTSKNFYDLTKSNSSTPEILRTAETIDLTESPPDARISPPPPPNVLDILPPKSSLWKSKVDIRKTSWMDKPNIPSRENATPIEIPSNPPRGPLHNALGASHDYVRRYQDLDQDNLKPGMDAEQALKDFFESAIEPEEEDPEGKDAEESEKSGRVDGLLVTLMAHQIEGLKFMLEHEGESKGKKKYGGILADDVYPSIGKSLI